MEDKNLKNKSDVEKKIKKQIEKKKEKNEQLGIYRIIDYMKEEHKWENIFFVFVSLLTLALGCLILTGALVVKDNFPVIGQMKTAFGWILVGFASVGLVYAIYPFFKPAFPEFKKISWLPMNKFVGNIIRVFTFLIILTLLFLLYDAFISQILGLFF